MKLTKKENIKINKVFKEKVSLETLAMLGEDRNLLRAQIELFCEIAIVDNCVNENVLLDINSSDEDILELTEKYIDPIYDELVQEYDLEYINNEIVEDIIRYIENEYNNKNTLAGIIDEVYNKYIKGELDDLRFFFNKAENNVENKIEDLLEDPEEKKKKQDKKEYEESLLDIEGASLQLKQLIQEYSSIKENDDTEKPKDNE